MTLVGTFTLRRTRTRHYAVTGTVRARLTQISVVSLEPFESDLIEPVDLTFSDDASDDHAATHDPEADPPDPIVNGQIDLGAITAEFLALALDPYPRKAGEVFVGPNDATMPDPSPLAAALSRLKPDPKT